MSEDGDNMLNKPVKFLYRVEDIFNEYYAPFCYFASRYVSKEHVVEDLVQDLFASLIEKKQTF